QLALQLVRVTAAAARGALWPNGVAHPLLVPGRLIHAVVVAAAARDGHLVNLRVEEHATGRVLAAGRGASDADAADVVVGVLRGDGGVPEDSVREAGVAEVLPAGVVERLG